MGQRIIPYPEPSYLPDGFHDTPPYHEVYRYRPWYVSTVRAMVFLCGVLEVLWSGHVNRTFVKQTVLVWQRMVVVVCAPGFCL